MSNVRRALLWSVSAAMVALGPISAAAADERITYGYDARGRLVQVSRSGTINNGVQATYGYDMADNRTQVTVSGVAAPPPPPPPSYSIGDAGATEGANVPFSVTRTGDTSGSTTINFATSDGSAVTGGDYIGGTGTLSFAPGEATKVINIGTIDDGAVESSESFSVTLAGASGGGTISDALGVGTITDNDVAGPAAPVASNPFLQFSQSSTNTIFIGTLATFSGTARIISFTPPANGGSATIAADGQSVSYTAPYVGIAPVCEPAYIVTFSVPYAVQATPSGPSTSGTATINVRSARRTLRPGEQCP